MTLLTGSCLFCQTPMMAPAATSIDKEQGRVVQVEGIIACSHCGAFYRATLTELKGPNRPDAKKNMTDQQVEYEKSIQKLKDQTDEQSK